MTQDYTKALQDLNAGKNPADDVQAAAQAANQATEGLTQNIEREWRKAMHAVGPLQRHAAMQKVQSDLLLLQNIMQTQDTFQQELAQAAWQLAQKYQKTAPSKDGQKKNGGTTPNGGKYSSGGTTPNGGKYSSGGTTPSGGKYSSGGTTPGQTGGTTPGQTGGMTPGGGKYSSGGTTPGQTGGMIPGQTGSMIPGQTGGMTSGQTSGAQDSLSSLMSMLPMMLPMLMMMPMMLIPMLASMGGRQQPQPQPQPQGPQLASATQPGQGPKPQDKSASNTDDANSDGKTQSVADKGDKGTQPTSSVQPAGNSVPAGSNTEVKLKNGTSIHAPNAQAAAAIKAADGGANPVDAYKQAGIDLPPPGTPVTNPVFPPQAGDIGVWTDHDVMSLGGGKVMVDGQPQPDSSLGSDPGFLGWMRPTQQSSEQSSVQPAVAEPTPASSPAQPPGSGAPVQAAIGAP